MSLTINQRTATLGPLRPPQLWYRFQYPEDSWTEGDPPIDFYLSVETVFRIFNRLGEYLEEYAPAWDTEPLLLQPKDAHRSLLIIFAAIFNEMNWIECYFPTLANQNIENLVRFMDFHACEEKLDYDATHRLYNWLIRASTLPRSASLRHDRLWLAEFIHAGIVLMRVDKRAWPIFYTCEDGTIQVAIQSNSVEHHLKHFYNAAIADNETTWEMWLRLLALAKCFEQNVLQDRISWHMAFTTKYWDRKTHKCPRTLLYLLGTCNEVHGPDGNNATQLPLGEAVERIRELLVPVLFDQSLERCYGRCQNAQAKWLTRQSLRNIIDGRGGWSRRVFGRLFSRRMDIWESGAEYLGRMVTAMTNIQTISDLQYDDCTTCSPRETCPGRMDFKAEWLRYAEELRTNGIRTRNFGPFHLIWPEAV